MNLISVEHAVRLFSMPNVDFLEQVESEDTYQRIGGTSTGGGTFWGLGSLLTKAKVKS